MSYYRKLLCIAAFLGLWTAATAAVSDPDFKVAKVLQSNMVVQQNKPFRIWGKAAAGKIVKLTADWFRDTVNVSADEKGAWVGAIDVPKAKKGDFTAHTISIIQDKSIVKLDNILIGELWLCSGQSNMEMTMKPFSPWHKGVINSEQEIAKANYPNIRLFRVPRDTSSRLEEDVAGTWQPCSPETVANFSGVAYYFGRELFQKLNIPIGLLVSAYGGASCQAFTSREVLQANPVLKARYLDAYDKDPASVKVLTNKPTLMYNEMIYPLRNLSVKGFLWYQGESNAGEGKMYSTLCTAMMNGWRKDFQQGDLPFYYVQMTPYNWKKANFFETHYAVFREAQEAILKEKNTSMAVTMDVGEPDNIHPQRKKEVGVRLSRIALNKTYNFSSIPYRGPQLKRIRVAGDKIIVSFHKKSLAGGLVTSNSASPKHFYIASADSIYAEAKAVLRKNKIMLTSEKVKNPVSVRYAFFNAAETNLMNRAGLPAHPFRTDKSTTVTYK